MTGIQDPFEEPGSADLVIDTTVAPPAETASLFIERLKSMGRL